VTLYDEKFDTRAAPERVFYEAGVLLDAEDLRAEQAYHRGRLTRVLTYLHGVGTAAGLRVTFDAASDELRVAPGIAIDRLGRLIEVPKPACVRVDRWLERQRQMLENPDAFEGESALLEALNGDRSAVVADVFVRFVVCSRGRTPAFASGPFDAIDASVPHRLRDAYELSLELRGGDAAPLPTPAFPTRAPDETLVAWQGRLRESVLDGWRHGSESFRDGAPLPDPSTAGVADPSAVFLARVRVPVEVPADSPIPVRRSVDGNPAPVQVENERRLLVYSTAALLSLLEAAAVQPPP
jgi:hypothetical protein